MKGSSMTRIYLTLDDHEWKALATLSFRECRSPKEQLRYLLRQEAGLNVGTNSERKINQSVAPDRQARNALVESR